MRIAILWPREQKGVSNANQPCRHWGSTLVSLCNGWEIFVMTPSTSICPLTPGVKKVLLPRQSKETPMVTTRTWRPETILLSRRRPAPAEFSSPLQRNNPFWEHREWPCAVTSWRQGNCEQHFARRHRVLIIRRMGSHCCELCLKYTSYLWKIISCHISDCNFSLDSFARPRILDTPENLAVPCSFCKESDFQEVGPQWNTAVIIQQEK